MAHKDTLVILDDTIFTSGWEEGWTFGPTQVWTEFLNDNKILFSQNKDYSKGLGMAWGKYNI